MGGPFFPGNGITPKNKVWKSKMNNYKARVYANYVESAEQATPENISLDLNDRAPTMRHIINSYFPTDKESKIIDAGCGYGTLIHFAKEHGYSNACGIDVSSQQVALAKKLGIHNVEEGDLLQTLRATSPSSLDAIVSIDVIEHFSKSELFEFADTVNAALKPGGRWIIHCPNAASPFFGIVRYGDITHELAFTTASLGQLLKSCGFSRIEFEECRPQVHGLKSLIRFTMWKIVRSLYRSFYIAETGGINISKIMTQNLYAVAFKKEI